MKDQTSKATIFCIKLNKYMEIDRRTITSKGDQIFDVDGKVFEYCAKRDDTCPDECQCILKPWDFKSYYR